MINNEESRFIIYTSDDGKAAVTLLAKDGNVWMNQSQLAELFNTSKQNIGQHVNNILQEKELQSFSVVKNFFTTASDGKDYNVEFYSLDMILAIGFRVRSRRGTQFRIWANKNLKEFMVKGFIMDDERLKKPDGRPDYFDEFMERIREIRASEKRFYQKVQDLFKLSSDYDKTDKATQMFFAETQNKLLYAVTLKTAADLIVSRANPNKQNMGLTSTNGLKVRKADIFTAKNYLTEDEIDTLNRLVIIFLETAELRVKNRIDITMEFWKENVDRILDFNDKPLLKSKGSIPRKLMKEQVGIVYAEYDKQRRAFEAKEADEMDLKELTELENKLSKR
ncbi:MAG: hydroxyacid dehydrogenase [Candidatus Cloacimonetes bacterium 4572_65]|nr:MAG: hydroxyacid dehydrogenase [Candidatus Cloacimonetes bacterium 4572_65]